MKPGVILIALLVISGSLVYTLDARIEGLKALVPPLEDEVLMPDPIVVRHFALGYDRLVSTLLWLHTIQQVGKHGASCCFRWIYKAIDHVTTLDPHFSWAYQFGGLLLAMPGEALPLSNALFEKGERSNPDVWQLPFYRGFNDLFYLGDQAAAARRIGHAARLPGAPPPITHFAVALYLRTGERETAITLLQDIAEHTPDETVRAFLNDRIESLQAASPSLPTREDRPE